MARKKKEEVVIQEPVQKQNEKVPEQQPPVLKIILKKDTEFRKFPTLSKIHVVAVGKKGTMYEVVQPVSTPYGYFYKLDNGYYVVREGDYIVV